MLIQVIDTHQQGVSCPWWRLLYDADLSRLDGGISFEGREKIQQVSFLGIGQLLGKASRTRHVPLCGSVSEDFACGGDRPHKRT